jgi:Ca2+-binding EF-hand superfamily protein
MIHQGSNEEKLVFAFKLYDSDGNGVLDMNEVATLVSKIFLVSDTLTNPDEDHVQQFFNKMDRNNDGEISLQEFIDACKDDPAILGAIENSITSVVESANETSFFFFIFESIKCDC